MPLLQLELEKIKIESAPSYPHSPCSSLYDFDCFHDFKRSIDIVAYFTANLFKQAIDKGIKQGKANQKYTGCWETPTSLTSLYKQ